VAAASAIVLLTYALLIESWRRVLGELGGKLDFRDAARIWLVSNLARYLPGAFWQLGAMSEMARRRGVPVTVSTGSAILITVVNLFTGLGVFALFAAASPVLHSRGRVVIALGALGLVVAPFVLPHLQRIVRRLTGRDIVMPRFGLRPVLIAGVATAISWIAYGFAFWLLTRAILPGEPRSLAGCIAIYTASYLTGLFNPAPAGIGAAEGAMVVMAPQFGVATGAEAAVLATVVRIWRSVLEALPGLLALALTRERTPEHPPTSDAVSGERQASRGSRIP
jgi:uncharacterized membrane protein YbhN (UPF0104 family)